MNWLVRPSARDAAVLFKTVAERNDKQVEGAVRRPRFENNGSG
jgi:hypothetical protein